MLLPSDLNACLVVIDGAFCGVDFVCRVNNSCISLFLEMESLLYIIKTQRFAGDLLFDLSRFRKEKNVLETCVVLPAAGKLKRNSSSQNLFLHVCSYFMNAKL